LGESGCLRVQPKSGGILHLRLNIDEKPIAHKYRKGKMQRTLKREFKELEVVGMEAIVSNWILAFGFSWFCLFAASIRSTKVGSIHFKKDNGV